MCEATFGQIQDLPEPRPGVLYVTSALVAQAAKRARFCPGMIYEDQRKSDRNWAVAADCCSWTPG